MFSKTQCQEFLTCPSKVSTVPPSPPQVFLCLLFSLLLNLLSLEPGFEMHNSTFNCMFKIFLPS